MTQHTDLIDRLRCFDRVTCNEAADALEAQAREIAELKAQLAATAKTAFEAMPHDIPQRMKDTICEETGWSGSMVSRMYTELRKAFTGEPYRANEDLDAALLEVARLRKDAERYRWIREGDGKRAPEGIDWPLIVMHESREAVWESDADSAIDAAVDAVNSQKGQP